MAMNSMYTLKHKTRCIAPVLSAESNQFLVGTCNLLGENELHLLEYNEDKSEVSAKTVFRHPKEVWSISSCPSKQDLVFTVYNTGDDFRASLWRMREGPPSSLDEVAQLRINASTVLSVLWDPSGLTETVLSLDDTSIREWRLDIGSSSCREVDATKVGEGAQRITGGAWDPLNSQMMTIATETALRGWDVRNKKQTSIIEAAHAQTIRGVEYNPNKPNSIATCGDDGFVRYWDLRNPSKPLKSMRTHAHWATSVKFNPHHEQLVLTSGADSLVKLWNVPDFSSSSSAASSPTPSAVPTEPKLLQSIDAHEDSVYSTCWSSFSPWVYASCSFDGTVFVHQVPQETKISLLQL